MKAVLELGGSGTDCCPSSIILGFPAVKYLTAKTAAQSEEPPLRYSDFIRLAVGLTLASGVVCLSAGLLAAAASCSFDGLVIAGRLWLYTVPAVWFSTLTVGCLVM